MFWPFSLAGLNTHCLMASKAASRKMGRPLVSFKLLIFPSFPTVNSTVTVPLSRRARAIAGYIGATFLTTCAGSRSDCEIMDGVEEAGGLATRAEISPWVFPWPRLRFGATSPGFWPPTAGLILDSPVAIATAAGVDAAAGVEGVEAEGLGCLLADRSSLFRVISGATVSGTGFTG